MDTPTPVALADIPFGHRALTPKGIEIVRVEAAPRAGRSIVRYMAPGGGRYRTIEVDDTMRVTPLPGKRASDPLEPAFGLVAAPDPDAPPDEEAEPIADDDVTPEALRDTSDARLAAMEAALDAQRKRAWATGNVDPAVVKALHAIRGEAKRRKRAAPPPADDRVPPAPAAFDAATLPQPTPDKVRHANCRNALVMVPEAPAPEAPPIRKPCKGDVQPGTVLQGERWGIAYRILALEDGASVRVDVPAAKAGTYPSLRAAVLAVTGREKLGMGVGEWLRLPKPKAAK